MGYKTYTDDNRDEVEFTVFIIHGHSDEWIKVERFIKDELRFNAIVLQQSYTGQVVLDKFKDAVWDSDCAIAIMSPDDIANSGNYRARQNVLFEIGYCQGLFDSYYYAEDDESEDEYDFEPVIIVKEQSIDFREVSDLLGLEVINYMDKNIESTFFQLGKALKRIYKQLKD